MTNNSDDQTRDEIELVWDPEAEEDFEKFPKSAQDRAKAELRALRSSKTRKKLGFHQDGIRYTIHFDVDTKTKPWTVKQCRTRLRLSRWTVTAFLLFAAGIALYVVGVKCFHAAPDNLVPHTFGDREPGVDTDKLRAALWGDIPVIVGYALMFGVCAEGLRRLAFSPFGLRLARFAGAAVIIAVLADITENSLLCWYLGKSVPDGAITAIAVAATIKWCALIGAAVAVPSVIGAWLRRTWGILQASRAVRGGQHWWDRVKRDDPSPGPAPNSGPAADRQEGSWREAYDVPGALRVVNNRAAQQRSATAICLSGGGVRSACIAMGAMQIFSKKEGYDPKLHGASSAHPVTDQRHRTLLDQVDYVISVSGGGYSAGARLLAVQPERPASEPAQKRGGRIRRWIGDRIRSLVRVPPGPELKELDDEIPLSDRFQEGSVEFEHFRRHSSYIANSPIGLMGALGYVLKNLVASLVSLFWIPVAAGYIAGVLLAKLPMAALVPITLSGDEEKAISDTPEHYVFSLVDHPSAWWAIGIFAVAALLVTAYAIFAEMMWSDESGEKLRIGLILISFGCAAFALLIFTITVALPVLMRLCSSVAADKPSTNAGFVASVVGLQYIVAIVAMVYRGRHKLPIDQVAKQSWRKLLPRGVVQQGLVLLTLAALLLAWLVVLGSVAAGVFRYLTHPETASPDPQLSSPAGWYLWALAGAAILILLIALADATSMSLHPYYRWRLARTFAVRRRRISGAQDWLAQRYPDSEPTWLHDYGRVSSGPQFVFAAAAAMSGENKGAPGLDAVSFVMSADYIGGPQLGWLKTRPLWEASSPRIRRDLTVQAAVAISGAAFASAMGRQSKGFQTLLAASGARLGTWLPNPNFVGLLQNPAADYAGRQLRWLPGIRGSSYFYRELFGINKRDARLVQVTDGGHYENLGLVEALRRRCKIIYCIDGGGDAPPFLTGLADAIRLAKYELGVEIKFNSPTHPADDLTPSSGQQYPSDHAFAHLNRRITKATVIKGTIQYPPAAGLGSPDQSVGTLIYAKAVLWQGCPDWLMTYAGGSEVFPHDTTADQWFTEGQFAAYTELGRIIGKDAVAAQRL